MSGKLQGAHYQRKYDYPRERYFVEVGNQRTETVTVGAARRTARHKRRAGSVANVVVQREVLVPLDLRSAR